MIEGRVAAFRNSMQGLRSAARTEAAVRIELAALAGGIPVALLLSDSPWVFAGLIGSLLIVLAVELLNTGLEKLCDHVCPQHHTTIGMIKDIGPAAVMFTLALAGLVWSVGLLRALIR